MASHIKGGRPPDHGSPLGTPVTLGGSYVDRGSARSPSTAPNGSGDRPVGGNSQQYDDRESHHEGRANDAREKAQKRPSDLTKCR